MKKHYVRRHVYDCFAHVTAMCGQRAFTLKSLGEPQATFRKNYVTCESCKATKVFRGVK